MPRYDEHTAQCRIFTFKEGLLSPIGHDLEIEVARFELEWNEDETTLEAHFDPTSLRVLHAMKDDRPLPGVLSVRDKQQIEEHIRKDVLSVDRDRGPIRFVSSAIEGHGERRTVRGMLELHGCIRPIEVRAHRRGERWIAEADLHQPDFGIRPFSAMMGTLRVRATVRVRVTAPA
jgi:hypothetical protein